MDADDKIKTKKIPTEKQNHEIMKTKIDQIKDIEARARARAIARTHAFGSKQKNRTKTNGSRQMQSKRDRVIIIKRTAAALQTGRTETKSNAFFRDKMKKNVRNAEATADVKRKREAKREI